jgi:hypothetical protein
VLTILTATTGGKERGGDMSATLSTRPTNYSFVNTATTARNRRTNYVQIRISQPNPQHVIAEIPILHCKLNMLIL